MMMANTRDFQVKTSSEVVTILSGQTTSGSIDLHGTSLIGIITPSALTGTVIRCKGSIDVTLFNDMYDSGGLEITIDVGTDRYIPLNVIDDFKGVRFLKLVSNQSEADDRNITLVLRY